MDAVEGKHHTMFRKKIDGVTVLVTRMSRGTSSINDSLGHRMANQCCLQLREFWNLVDCALSEQQWDALVTQRCSGGRNPFIGR
jgi:hypothetical protein